MTAHREEAGRLIVTSHAEAVEVATSPDVFSSKVSRFLQVPNGLDGAEHAEMRRILDPFLNAEAIGRAEPALAEVAREVVAWLPEGVVDAVTGFGSLFAVRAQSTWLGWSRELEGELLDWMDANHEATRSGELERTRAVAERFDAIIRSLLEERRAPGVPRDLTTDLMAVTKEDGTPLSDAELVSILRNWTGGDLGSLALCLGVLVARLIAHPEDQDAWRAADDATLDSFIDEALRIDDPFTSNRRVAACPHMLGEHALETGDRLVIHWTSANRDPEAFGDPEEFRPAENAAKNLVYGIGPHVCPGRGLATTELRVAIRALLDRFDLASGGEGTRASEPLGGWESMPVRLLARSRS